MYKLLSFFLSTFYYTFFEKISNSYKTTGGTPHKYLNKDPISTRGVSCDV